jgi:hypothetical protein
MGNNVPISRNDPWTQQARQACLRALCTEAPEVRLRILQRLEADLLDMSRTEQRLRERMRFLEQRHPGNNGPPLWW